MAKRTWGPNTWNNYTEQDYDQLKNWIIENCSWGGIGREIGDECGTPHLQFGFTCKETKRMAALKKIFGDAPHWEQTIYPKAMERYIRKEGDYWETGEIRPGKRSDLADAVSAMKGGASMRDLYSDHTEVMVRYGTGMARAMKVLREKVTTSPHTVLRWPLQTDLSKALVFRGPSQIGKTQYALQHFPRGCLVVRHRDDLGRFDPVIHDGIVFDDMDFRRWPRSECIALLDMELSSTIDIKYGTAMLPARTPRIFTTNIDIFPVDSTKAIENRIRVVEMH